MTVELASVMAEKYKAFRRAYAQSVMAEANKSVVKYQIRVGLRQHYADVKVSEARLEEESKSAPQLIAAIRAHGDAIVECGDAEAAYMLAKAEYEASLPPSS